MLEHILFVTLNLVLLLVFVINARGANRYKSQNVIAKYYPSIIAFTLILGARYMRGNDYLHYQDVYNHGNDYEQKLFDWLNDTMHLFYISDTGIFFVYSLIFIVGATIIWDYYSSISKWLVPIFLICFILFDEWFIRQAVAYSFLFVFARYLFDSRQNFNKRFIYSSIFAFIAIGMHTATIIPLLAILLFYFFYSKPICYYYTIPLFLFATFYVQYSFNFSDLSVILNYVADNGSGHFAEYAKQDDQWFSADAIQQNFARNPIVKIIETIGEVSFLYLGYKVLKSPAIKNLKGYVDIKSLVVFFNVHVVGIIIVHSFFLLEIPKRIGQSMSIFWCFPFAFVLYNLKYMKLTVIDRLCCCGLAYFVYDYIKYLFFRTDAAYPYLFIWDKI